MKNLWYEFRLGTTMFLLLSAVHLMSGQGRQELTGVVPQDISRLGLRPIGRLDSLKNLHLSIGLPLRNKQELNTLLRDINAPTNLNYHHYLTVQQFTQEFGPTSQDYQAVVAFAKENGLTVEDTSPNHMILDVSGSVDKIEKTLHISFQLYHHPSESRDFYAPDQEPTLDLQVPVLGIEGLTDFYQPRPTDQATQIVGRQMVTSGTGSGPGGGYMGYDYRAAYLPDVTVTGTGQSVGLLEFDGYYSGDITYYEDLVGLPHVSLLPVPINYNGTLGDNQIEVSMNIENVISMAPGLSQVIVYEDGNANWHDILNRMATDNLAKQLSCSWVNPGAGADPVAEQIFVEMAAQGQTFICSSGNDDAATGLISFPEDSPNITIVGGTTLVTSGRQGSYISEAVWNAGDQDGSGGGSSTQYAIPSWQQAVSMSGNQGSTTMRNVPDVALVAENVYIRARGADYIKQGTSCAAPLWAGLVALANEQSTAGGGTFLGFINPILYGIGLNGSKYSAAFHDITTGNNEWSSSPTKFSAVTGYDLCSGWGTPKGQALIDDLTIFSVSLSSPSILEGGSAGTYEVNGVNEGANWSGTIYHGQTVKADPPAGYSFLSWNDGSTDNPRAITYDFSGNAVFKGIHLSNTTAAWDNTSQRKLIETNTGYAVWLHQVYTSAGHVWLEHSSDGGHTWILGNNGQPLDGANGGKCPCISFTTFTPAGGNTNYHIGVVWQEPYGSTYKIKGRIFNQLAWGSVPIPMTPTSDLWTEGTDSYSVNANPNLLMAAGYTAGYLVVFERKSSSPGLNWVVGHTTDTGNQNLGPFGYPEQQGVISGTDANSTNVQITRDPYYDNTANVVAGDLVYSTGVPGEVFHAYEYLFYDGAAWDNFSTGATLLSYPANVNFSPSVITFPISEFAACWIEYDQLAYIYGANPSTIYYYGSGVQSCSMNRGGDENGFMAWSSLGGSWTNNSMRLDYYYPNSSTTQTLSTAGKYVQVGNSTTPDVSNMYVSSFYPFTSPYTFGTSAVLGPLAKKAITGNVEGRGFIVNAGSASFRYELKALSVDGNYTGFVNAPDTIDYSNIGVLNNSLVSEPFQLNANSKVLFAERLGCSDSVASIKALGDTGFVRYKIDLIDNTTGNVVGTVKDVNLSSADLHSLQTRWYSLAATGLGTRIARLKITVATNLIGQSVLSTSTVPAPIKGKMVRRQKSRPSVILTKSLAPENSVVADSAMQQLALETNAVPASFGLGQNFPNPFNPTTQINYQLPEPAHVSLKIYDILGRLVTTLVDDMNQAGYYSVSFDGSKLASGVYLTRFIVKPQDGTRSIVQTRKIVLMK